MHENQDSAQKQGICNPQQRRIAGYGLGHRFIYHLEQRFPIQGNRSAFTVGQGLDRKSTVQFKVGVDAIERTPRKYVGYLQTGYDNHTARLALPDKIPARPHIDEGVFRADSRKRGRQFIPPAAYALTEYRSAEKVVLHRELMPPGLQGVILKTIYDHILWQSANVPARVPASFHNGRRV